MISMRNLTITMCLVMLTGYLFAGGFALSGVGSRATSMGGAFRGVSNDASAMYWNPAGLGFMNENSVHLGGTFIMPSASWDPTGTVVAGVPGFGPKEYEAKKELKMLPTVTALMGKESRLKYGLGVFVPYGLGTKWDAYKLPTTHPSGAPLVYVDGFPEYPLLSSVSVIDVHPSVAYRLLHNLSVGAGLSLMQGNIDINKVDVKPEISVFSPITTELSGSGMGFGSNLGLLFKPLPCLSLGLSGKLPSTIKMKGDADINLWKPASVDSLGNPVAPAKIGGKGDIEADLKLPAEIGIGFAYQVMPNWTVSLDYAYTMWESLDEVEVQFKEIHPVLQSKKTTLPFNWENTSRVSLGTEYLCGLNKIRGGFFFDQSPIPEATQTPTLSDIGNKTSFNLGYGRVFGPIEVEANAQYVMFPERKVQAVQEGTNTPGVYNSQSVSGNLGLTYRF
ncbi:MAG: outer membrane protein transport protein [Candidatus Cloacimonetes bacterium]|nr:outer membrane protein transport protein [Candidatus Cloacimonadota bacterium]